jgi:hypothetical protein
LYGRGEPSTILGHALKDDMAAVGRYVDAEHRLLRGGGELAGLAPLRVRDPDLGRA